MNYKGKWPVYARQWDAMSINPSRLEEFKGYAQFAVEHKAIYKEIETETGVPWPMVAVLHRRENPDFNTYLGNGQPLNRVTTIVPRGRGPFPSFKAGAIDALRQSGLSMVKDWRLEKMLYYCELYNGAGYFNRGLASPYVWGGTNQQQRGKYVADGQFNPNTMDGQPGCAPILKMIAQLDPTVTYPRETVGDTPAPVTKPEPIDLASHIVDAMERGKCVVDRNPGEVNIVYVEGLNTDGTPNKNRINAFDDIRCVLSVPKSGAPKILGVWEATIETGVYYTENPIAEDGAGAARITFGQQRAWQFGFHHGYEALVQTGGPVSVYRDKNADYRREGDRITTGWYGINQHHGFNASRDNIGYNSAGCLVGRMVRGHEEFMKLIKSDPRYKANRSFVFPTTVLTAAQVLQATPEPIKPPVAPAAKWSAWGAFLAGAGALATYLGAHPTIIVIAAIAATIGIAILIHRK